MGSPIYVSSSRPSPVPQAPTQSPAPARPILDSNLVNASRRYRQAETIKETIYQNEGWFPGLEPRYTCHVCEKDGSVKEKEMSKFWGKNGIAMHLHGPFHSPYSHWRRLRVQEATQFAAFAAEEAKCATANVNGHLNASSESDRSSTGASKPRVTFVGDAAIQQVKPKLIFYCPYPFCRSGGKGWKSLHELVAHVEGSSEETEDLRHEYAKWGDGWGDDDWLVNSKAKEMVLEMEARRA